MYNKGSAEFNNLIEKSGGQSLKPRLVFDDFIIENIIKLEYYGGSNNSDDITIGTTTTSYVDVEIVTDKVIVNQEFLLEAGFLIDGEYEYAPIGYFTIQLPEVEDDNISFKAYDRMQKLEKPYNSSLQFPTNDNNIVEEICTKCGIQLATPIVKPIMVNEIPQGYTCREILGYIAGIHGFFACFDRYGRLNLRWYEETPIEKSVSVIWSLTKEQKNHTISKVVMARDSETIYTSGNGITSINTSNPLATQQIADNVYNSLNGYSYRPANISMLDDIRIDPWDTIKIVYFDGNTYIIPTMVLEHSFSNCETKITAVGKSEIENEYSYTGPIMTALERTQTELLVANRVIATKVDAEWVQANTITADKLEATNARVGVLEANSLTVTQADLKYANIQLGNIDIANINKASIGNLFAEVGLLTSAIIQNGHVTGYLDSVEVNADSITAGTLITDRLVFRGQEKSIIYELNNITGALQSVQSDTLNGEILTDRSITVDKIVAKSITANEIAAGTLTANELNVANVFGNSAVLNTLTSQSAFINAVSTNSVVVGAGKSAELAKKMVNGKLLHNDPMFMSGDNGVAVYNQLHNGNVTVIRVLKSSYNITSCPTTSNYIIRIQTTGAASPKHGGFVRSFYSRPNAVFIIKYLINLPKGYYLKAASNSMGTGFTDEFIGDTEGTGTWKEYYRMTTCGETGTFSTGGYVYIEGSGTPTSSSPLVWYLGAIYTYDVTDANPIDGWLYQDTTLIDGGKIYTGTVTADAIAANAVTTAKLAANAVTADKLSVSSLSAITANLGTVTAGIIKMKNVEDKTAYITYEDKGGYSNQIGAYGMTLHADRENTSVGAGYMIMQAQYDEAAIVISRYATDYSTDIAPGWGMFSHRLSVGGYNNTAYALSAKSIIAQSIVTESGANLDDINDRLKNLTFYADTATTPSATGSYKAIRTLPSGFTVNNTYIIAIMIQRSDTAAWQAMDGQISAYIADTHLYVYVGNSFWANRPMKILFARR